jgi:hypothetical protein
MRQSQPERASPDSTIQRSRATLAPFLDEDIKGLTTMRTVRVRR